MTRTTATPGRPPHHLVCDLLRRPPALAAGVQHLPRLEVHHPKVRRARRTLADLHVWDSVCGWRGSDWLQNTSKRKQIRVCMCRDAAGRQTASALWAPVNGCNATHLAQGGTHARLHR